MRFQKCLRIPIMGFINITNKQPKGWLIHPLQPQVSIINKQLNG